MLKLLKTIILIFMVNLIATAQATAIQTQASLESLDAKEYKTLNMTSVEGEIPNVKQLLWEDRALDFKIEDVSAVNSKVLSFTLPVNSEKDILLPINFRIPLTPMVDPSKAYKELFVGDHFSKIDGSNANQFYLGLFKLFAPKDGVMKLEVLTNKTKLDELLIYTSFLEKNPSILDEHSENKDPIENHLSNPAKQSRIFQRALGYSFNNDFSKLDELFAKPVNEQKRLFSKLVIKDILWFVVLLRYGKDFIFEHLDSFGLSPAGSEENDSIILNASLGNDDKCRELCDNFLNSFNHYFSKLNILNRLSKLHSKGLIHPNSTEFFLSILQNYLVDLLKVFSLSDSNNFSRTNISLNTNLVQDIEEEDLILLAVTPVREEIKLSVGTTLFPSRVNRKEQIEKLAGLFKSNRVQNIITPEFEARKNTLKGIIEKIFTSDQKKFLPQVSQNISEYWAQDNFIKMMKYMKKKVDPETFKVFNDRIEERTAD